MCYLPISTLTHTPALDQIAHNKRYWLCAREKLAAHAHAAGFLLCALRGDLAFCAVRGFSLRAARMLLCLLRGDLVFRRRGFFFACPNDFVLRIARGSCFLRSVRISFHQSQGFCFVSRGELAFCAMRGFFSACREDFALCVVRGPCFSRREGNFSSCRDDFALSLRGDFALCAVRGFFFACRNDFALRCEGIMLFAPWEDFSPHDVRGFCAGLCEMILSC